MRLLHALLHVLNRVGEQEHITHHDNIQQAIYLDATET